MKITWRELAIDISEESPDEILKEWRWLIPSGLSLRMVSALGDAFLENELGEIYWLDTGSAEISKIAASRDEFDTLRQTANHADQWFSPMLVGDLLSSGKSLSHRECFSYKIPLTLGGSFSPENFKPTSVAVHFSTLGQIQKQVRDLPIGTKISSVKLGV
ncbi:DUF1851 domain-containing protein [Pseudomonas sp. LjRoot71]|uniref:T6SS immunity protein Tdi1 domain-containing protein n=1 Tax=Pseudomonas sp. LjRoot71 TaxID=3342336 RepID=UPI003ED0E512